MQRKSRRDPIWGELLYATIGVTCLGAFIALVFWWFTGISPWPMLILSEIAGFGFGIQMLAMASPRRN